MSTSASTRAVTLCVNDTTHELVVDTRTALLDSIREELQLTGTKHVCGSGNCGACTVLLDGEPVYACLLLTVDCDGQRIRTIEGVARNGRLSTLQQAFLDADAFQCGFCTPGQIMSLTGLFEAVPDPSADDIRRAVSGNLCRCGAYANIFRAGLAAAGLATDAHDAD